MANIIEMPKLSDTMTVGTVASWLKDEGDQIESGDVIAEIETDKATMELEAYEDGVLLKQIAPAGTQVAIGAPIAAIGEEGESFDSSSLPTTEEPAQPEPEDRKEETEAIDESEEQSKEPVAKEEEQQVEAEASVEKSAPDKKPAESNQSSDARIRISPLARKLAAEKGVEIQGIEGSGPNGRIVKKDILAAEGKPSIASPPPSPAETYTGAGIVEEQDIPLSQIRKIIAQRLVEAKTTIPHFYLEIEVNAGPLLKMRKQVNEQLSEVDPEKGGAKFTVNDFILKAATEALRRVPEMNRSWGDTSIRQHGSVHISFGVAIDDGLVTPVIKNADTKGLKQIAAEAKELIGKARSKKLTPDEMTGSTFTVTNLGMYGVSSFYGIINPPNAGILSVGATIARPVVKENGEIGAGQIMTLGLSGDHRVVDGAVGAQFLQALKSIIETPALILV